MSNRKKHNKKEHTTLKKAFLHSQIKIFGELANNIFGGIINRISQAKEEKRRNPKAYKRLFEFPFVQGDGIIAGLPDIIYESDDFVLGIEHFQFDATGKGIKGSKMRLAEIKAKAKIEEKKKTLTDYLNVNELTRAMSVELIERVIIGATPKDKNTPRKIQIVYKVDLV
ncbi:MAG: DUF4368 domain-containing protein [Clostridia bacterium]|nr:DUF4368 domain-containing protein [Clostridia bacterium]